MLFGYLLVLGLVSASMIDTVNQANKYMRKQTPGKINRINQEMVQRVAGLHRDVDTLRLNGRNAEDYLKESLTQTLDHAIGETDTKRARVAFIGMISVVLAYAVFGATLMWMLYH